jgi:hypothetical protein
MSLSVLFFACSGWVPGRIVSNEEFIMNESNYKLLVLSLKNLNISNLSKMTQMQIGVQFTRNPSMYLGRGIADEIIKNTKGLTTTFDEAYPQNDSLLQPLIQPSFYSKDSGIKLDTFYHLNIKSCNDKSRDIELTLLINDLMIEEKVNDFNSIFQSEKFLIMRGSYLIWDCKKNQEWIRGEIHSIYRPFLSFFNPKKGVDYLIERMVFHMFIGSKFLRSN